MDYTSSLDNVAHSATGHRMHSDSIAVPTAWSGNDANMVIWSLMEMLNLAGIEGRAFNPNDETSYTRFRDALLKIFATLDSPGFRGTPEAPTGTAGDCSPQIANNEFVQRAIGAGHVAFFARNTAPAGYLKANGAAVSRTTYGTLFASIGTTFGAGNGETTFHLPDLRGEFLRGWDDSRGIDSRRGLGTWQNHDFLSHTHNSPTANGVVQAVGREVPTTTSFGFDYADGAGAVPTQATGGTETRPRNVALLACIKY